MPKILLIAEACNPEWTSVPLEGWAHSQAIARATDAHLVTQIRNRDALLRAGLLETQDFTAINSEAVAAPLHKFASAIRGGAGKGWTTNTAVEAFAYYYFEHLVWKTFGTRIKSHHYDVVHRLTPLSPTVPSLLAKKCARAGVPFTLGPLNGGVPWPREFDTARRKEKEWLSYIRSAYRLLPGHRSTLQHAAAIIVGSADTCKQIPARHQHKTFYIPENAIDPQRFNITRQHSAQKPLRAVFVGRLVPYKGADMLLEAAAPLIRDGLLTVNIIGDGPQMPELQALVKTQNIHHGVKLSGWVPHTQLQNELAQADIFTFPSIREFGGAVVIEAMAVGLVPIVVNYAGPSELVSDRTGFRVPLGSRAQIIAGFHKILLQLAQHPEQIDALAPAALRRAHEHFTWPVKAQQLLKVWDWVTNAKEKSRPIFSMPIPDSAEPIKAINSPGPSPLTPALHPLDPSFTPPSPSLLQGSTGV